MTELSVDAAHASLLISIRGAATFCQCVSWWGHCKHEFTAANWQWGNATDTTCHLPHN